MRILAVTVPSSSERGGKKMTGHGLRGAALVVVVVLCGYTVLCIGEISHGSGALTPTFFLLAALIGS